MKGLLQIGDSLISFQFHFYHLNSIIASESEGYWVYSLPHRLFPSCFSRSCSSFHSGKSVTNSRGFVGRVGCVGPVGLWVCGFITWVCAFEIQNPQTHIFKLCGFVGQWVCGFVLQGKIAKGQPRFQILNAKIVQWLNSRSPSNFHNVHAIASS